MTRSVKTIGVDKRITHQWHGMAYRTARCQGTRGAPSCVCLCSVEQEEDKSKGLNEGVDQHKVDDEMGWDEWMV